jgi:hypothetical protein
LTLTVANRGHASENQHFCTLPSLDEARIPSHLPVLADVTYAVCKWRPLPRPLIGTPYGAADGPTAAFRALPHGWAAQEHKSSVSPDARVTRKPSAHHERRTGSHLSSNPVSDSKASRSRRFRNARQRPSAD